MLNEWMTFHQDFNIHNYLNDIELQYTVILTNMPLVQAIGEEV